MILEHFCDMRCLTGFRQRPHGSCIVSSAAFIFSGFLKSKLKTCGCIFKRFKLRSRIFSSFCLGLFHLDFSEQLTGPDSVFLRGQ